MYPTDKNFAFDHSNHGVCVCVCVCVCVSVCLCIPKKISIAKDRKCNSFEHRAVDLKMNDSDLLYKKF